MSQSHVGRFRTSIGRALLAAAFLIVLLALPAIAHAESWVSEYPVGLVRTQPAVVGVGVFSSASLDPRSAVISVDGVAYRTYVSQGQVSGNWVSTETLVDGVWKVRWEWVAETGVATKATLYCYPPVLRDGLHTVTAVAKDVNNATLTDAPWTFTVAAPPVFGSPTPAAGSSVASSIPAVSVPVSDNSGVTSVTATVNGVAATAALGSGRVAVTDFKPVYGTVTVTVRATDAAGNSAEKTWTFTSLGTVDQVCASAACHGTRYNADPAMGERCTACHVGPRAPAHGISHSPAALDPSCTGCHSTDLAVTHTESGVACLTCHYSTQPAVLTAIRAGNSACVACHPTAGHRVQHATPMLPTCAGASCHAGGDLVTVHGDDSCAICHTATSPAVAAAVAAGNKSCEACHDAAAPHGDVNAIHAGTQTSGSVTVFTNHNAITTGSLPFSVGTVNKGVGCASCHPTMNLLRVHGDDCGICHASAGPRSTFATWDKSCQQGACHPGLHDAAATQAAHIQQSCWVRTGRGCHSDGLDATYCTATCHSAASVLPGDATAPVTSLTTSETGVGGPPNTIRAWFKGPLHATLTAVDTGSGVGVLYSRVNSGAWNATLGTVATYTVSAPTTGTIEFYGVDRLGNTEATKSWLYGVDATAPVSQVSLYYAPNKYQVSVSDGVYEQSGGIRAFYYSWDDGALTTVGSSNPSPAYTTLYTIVTGPTNPGIHTLTYYAVDLVGNVETSKTLSYTIPDSGPPTASFEKIGWSGGRILATDAGATKSGVKSISYRVGATSPWTTVTFEATTNVSATQIATISGIADGSYALDYYATDYAGNSSATTRVSPFVIDTQTPPTVTITPEAPASDGSVMIRFDAVDAESGFSSTAFTRTSLAVGTVGSTVYSSTFYVQLWRPAWGTSETTTFTASATDRAGNVSAPVTLTYTMDNTVDLTAPMQWTSVGDYERYYQTGGNLDVQVGAADDQSGVHTVNWRVDAFKGVSAWQQSVIDAANADITVPFTGTGMHQISYYAVDASGNAGPETTVTFYMY